MAEFKLTLNDPKTGKSYQKQIKDEESRVFLGKSISEIVSGDSFGFPGYEFEIRGGSDISGFPMRKGILGIRKRLNILKSIGFRGGQKGMRKRKTVCGHKINEKISQINLKLIKEGKVQLAEALGVTDKPKDEKTETVKFEKKQ
mgnify:CR=1 FL=1